MKQSVVVLTYKVWCLINIIYIYIYIYIYSPNINTKTSAILMQNIIHKTEENSMQSERRKREKIDNLRVPQPNQ